MQRLIIRTQDSLTELDLHEQNDLLKQSINGMPYIAN